MDFTHLAAQKRELTNEDIKSLLETTHDQALMQNEEQISRFIRLRDDHMGVFEHLKTLPDKMSYEIMVPLGSKALMKGNMVHTNEILVSLGQDWFVKCSAKHSMEICGRRISQCEEMLKKLEDEKEFLSSRRNLPSEQDVFGAEGRVEIMEPYDEKEEEAWRIRHREKEREYRQKLAELRKEGQNPVNTEEDLFEKLDRLELMDELQDELDRLNENLDSADSDDESEDGDDDDTDIVDPSSLIQTILPNDRLGKGNGLTLGVCDPPVNQSVSDSVLSTEEESRQTNMRRVSFADEKLEHSGPESMLEDVQTEDSKDTRNCNDSDSDVITINFRHTSVAAANAVVNNGTGDSSECIFHSPADIYKFYKDQTVLPSKSILKNKLTKEEIQQRMAWLEQSESVQIVNEDIEDRYLKPAVGHEVIEHPVSEDTTKVDPAQNRRVSKFKASRLAAKQ